LFETSASKHWDILIRKLGMQERHPAVNAANLMTGSKLRRQKRKQDLHSKQAASGLSSPAVEKKNRSCSESFCIHSDQLFRISQVFGLSKNGFQCRKLIEQDEFLS